VVVPKCDTTTKRTNLRECIINGSNAITEIQRGDILNFGINTFWVLKYASFYYFY